LWLVKLPHIDFIAMPS